MSPYAAPIIVVPRKSKLDAPLAETKRLVIDYRDLRKQIPKLQSTQVWKAEIFKQYVYKKM